MSVHSYPLLVSLYKGEGRILIVPIIDHVAGYSVQADWYENIPDTANAREIGECVLRAVEYIGNSPLSSANPKEREANAAWKKNSRYKSKTAFWKNNHYVRINITESNQCIVYSMKRSEKHQGTYDEIIKEVVLPMDTDTEEIGKSVIDVFAAYESYYGSKKAYKVKDKRTISLLDEKKIVINSRWDDKWVDFQDGGSAEIYQLYKYVADDGDVLACIYWGIAPELDCDMSRDNVMTSWKRLYGKVDVYEYKLVTGSIFSTCAEMENEDVHKISYYVQMMDDLLLECGLEILKENVSGKQVSQFIKFFNDVIVSSKISD